MQAEILIIPTPASLEMLKESAQSLAQSLVAQGVEVNEEISLCPDRKRLQLAISKALDRSDLLFTLGGMGRDSQFLAKQVMSEGLGLPLEHSRDSMLAIEDFAARTGLSLFPDDVTFASLPSGSLPLLPAHGVLPGCMISSPSQQIVMLPENALEVLPMLTHQVMPRLAKAGLAADSTHLLRTYGIGGSQVRQMMLDLMGTTNPVVTVSELGDETAVQVSAKGKTTAEAAAISTPVLRTIAGRLGDYAYGLDVESLEEAVVQKMARKELTLTIAEAGTSGMFAQRISETPGGAEVLVKAITAEDNESKIALLGMTPKELKRQGDVSEYTAVQMAHGARYAGNSHLGAAVCAHIPGFSQREEAVAYLAVCDDQDVYIKKILVEADSVTDSGSVVDAAVMRGLNMLRLFVDYLPQSYSGSVSLERALAGKVTVTDKETYQEDGFAYGDSAEKPPKERGSVPKVKKLVLLLAVAMVLFGAGYLAQYQVKSMIAKGMREDVAAAYDATDLAAIKSMNPDTVGFVSLEGTEMRYPVVQVGDNDYYLRRDFEEKSNQHGIPFMDYRADAKKPSDNRVIYGHNMRDGQIFGELLNYKDQVYYQEHPIIQYDSGKGLEDYKVFSVFVSSASPSHYDDGVVFNYPKFVNAKDDQEYMDYIKQIRIRSLLNMPVDVEPGDQLLTLSTCDYDLGDSRFVVTARKVRSGEDPTVEVAEVEKNPTPLLPDAWYKNYGGSKPNVEAWSYEPPAASGSTKPPKQSSVEEVDDPNSLVESEQPSESGSSESPATSPPAVNSTQPDKAAQEAAAAAEASRVAEANRQAAAASKAEADRKAAEAAAAASKAEADRKAAEAAAAASKAEADRKAAEAAASKDEEDAKKAAEEAKAGAEDKAIEEARKAAIAAEEAGRHQQNTLNATDGEQAKKYAENAQSAANRATDAAAAAKAAAELSGTTRARNAAEEAEASAINGRRSAQTAQETARLKEDGGGELIDTGGSLKISSSGSYDPDDTLDIISRVVQSEVGTTFHPEAIKAQAVAAYTFIHQANASGTTPTVGMVSKADPRVQNIVREVLGQAVYYNGSYAFTPYHSTSAGATTSSKAVWGGSYPYLVSVDSSVDEGAKGFESQSTMSSDKVSGLISTKLGIETDGTDPSEWIVVVSEEEGGYNGRMSVCGETRSGSGTPLTGRMLRERVFGLRSAAFDVEYNSGSDQFVFTTYGYGHGVGMSQNGANLYAQQGWSYKEILEHYYPGAVVQ